MTEAKEEIELPVFNDSLEKFLTIEEMKAENLTSLLFMEDVYNSERSKPTSVSQDKAASLAASNIVLGDLGLGSNKLRFMRLSGVCDLLLETFVLRGWINVCVDWLPSHPELVKEFFANINSCNAESQSLTSVVRGKDIVFSIATVRDKLKLPVVNDPQWPLSPSLVPTRREIVRELTGGVFSELDKLRLCFVTPQYRMLLKIICSFIEPCTHTSDATPDQAILMYGLGRGYSFDLATKIWNEVYGYHLHPPSTSYIPFASLITRFLLDHHVYITPDEPFVLLPPPIGKLTLENSDKPITIPKGHLVPSSPPAPNYRPTVPRYSSLHIPPTFKFHWDVPIGGPSTSTSPPVSTSLPPTQRDINLMGLIQTEFASLHEKISKGYAAVLALGDRLSAIETRLGAKEQCAHVMEHVIDEVTKTLDVLAGSTRSYVSRYGTAPIVGVGGDNGADLAPDGDTLMMDD
ncbi:hypothetical protein Vadar_016708 [Vaccinium darrowii]|uniref:Uncharacterized protein n=1 Tax=Vaccinium darrowii TaxID=229202 RepID=A0ACB7XRC0_9ERIC|nr:hypothetical protein Vadar_016708 [Vaccinium darrowii]